MWVRGADGSAAAGDRARPGFARAVHLFTSFGRNGFKNHPTNVVNRLRTHALTRKWVLPTDAGILSRSVYVFIIWETARIVFREPRCLDYIIVIVSKELYTQTTPAELLRSVFGFGSYTITEKEFRLNSFDEYTDKVQHFKVQ